MRLAARCAAIIVVLCGAATWLSAQTTDVVFVNRTGATIYFLYASPATADTWGDDLLGSRVLASGDDHKVRLLSGAGLYDIRAVDSNDNEYIIWAFDLGASTRIEIGPASFVGLHSVVGGDSVLAWIDIVNETNYTIYEIYVAPADSEGWNAEHQLLGEREAIHDGETYRIEVDVDSLGTYIYDIMLVDEEGDRYVKWDVNLEIMGRLTYTLQDLIWE